MSLALGIAAFVVALLSMTIGTVLVVSISIPSSLYLVFMLISAAGAVAGIIAVILAATFRAQLRRRGSQEARGRALGGLIMGILAIPSPLMGFFLGAVAVGLAGH